MPRLRSGLCRTESVHAARLLRHVSIIGESLLPTRLESVSFMSEPASAGHTTRKSLQSLLASACGVCPMLHVALWEPEIPPNTGNIARLCAATGAVLHLIGRLGFRLDDNELRRAGLDFWPEVQLVRHASLRELEAAWPDARILCFTARCTVPYTQVAYQDGDCLLFGKESVGLPPEVLARFADRTFGIPMLTGKVRSLNLATAVGIVLYEALRQIEGW